MYAREKNPRTIRCADRSETGCTGRRSLGSPRLTSEIFERDARETAIVEVNFKDESARLVESSDAPKLTAEVLKTQGKPVKTVEMFYEDQMWKVEVWDGKPLRLEVEADETSFGI